MGILFRLALVAAALCAPLWLILPHDLRWTIGILALLVLSWLARLLSRQLDRAYRLRYLEGRSQEALGLLKPFRLLVSADQYALLTGDALLQADRLGEFEKLRTSKSLPEWTRQHLTYVLARKQKDWAGAEAALRRLLAQSPPLTQRVAAQAEMARVIAEFFPERVGEADAFVRQALGGLPPGPMTPMVEGIAGIVQVASERPQEGIDTLHAAIEKLGTNRVLSLPFVAEFHRWTGRALKALGRPQEAREELMTARTLTRLPSLIEASQADLDSLS